MVKGSDEVMTSQGQATRADIAERLRERRRALNLTQVDVAKIVHTSRSLIANFEAGARSASIDHVANYAEAVGMRLTVEPISEGGPSELTVAFLVFYPESVVGPAGIEMFTDRDKAHAEAQRVRGRVCPVQVTGDYTE